MQQFDPANGGRLLNEFLLNEGDPDASTANCRNYLRVRPFKKAPATGPQVRAALWLFERDPSNNDLQQHEIILNSNGKARRLALPHLQEQLEQAKRRLLI